MAELTTSPLKEKARKKQLPPEALINPIKVSPAIGSAFAVQGLKNAMPIYHAAPGCTFLSKVLLTQHFREPVAISGTDMKETLVVFGGIDELVEKAAETVKKQKPEIVVVISSSISEIRGDDLPGVIKRLSSEHGVNQVCFVSAPDYQGGFAEGYARTVESLVRKFAVPGPQIQEKINILPAPYMTSADIDEIKDVLEAFSLRPNVIPDLSKSMDGSEAVYRQMSSDGTSADDLVISGRAGLTISFGESVRPAGNFLENSYSVPHKNLPSLFGVRQTDKFIKILMEHTGSEDAPKKIKRDRARLIDLMVDAHLHLADRKAHIALEYDHAMALRTVFSEWGVETEEIIVPDYPKSLRPKGVSGDQVIRQGGLFLLEEKYNARKNLPDLLITNSHGMALSEKFGIPYTPMGFPVYNSFGANLVGRTGYRGTLRFLIETANQWKHG